MYEFIDKNGKISANSAKLVVIDKYGKVKEVATGGGGSPTGPAGGDLSGTYPNPSVIWVNGLTTYNSTYFAIPIGTTSQYIRGDGSLATFPTIPTVGTWGTLNYPTWTTGTPFVKMTAAGTFALDTNIYLTSITSLDVTTALGYTPEDVANKENTTLDNSATKYPTNNLVKTTVDLKQDLIVLSNRVIVYANLAQTFFSSIGIQTASFVPSGNTAVAATNTNNYTLQQRVRFSTTAVAGTLGFFRQAASILLINNNFIFDGMFGISAYQSGMRMFFGLSNASTATPTNVEPNTTLDALAIGILSTSTNLHILHNDATGVATTIDLGANFPINTNSLDRYYFKFENKVTSVDYLVFRINSSGVVSFTATGTISTNLPTTSTSIYYRAWITNNATAAIASFDINGFSNGYLKN